MPRLSHRSPDEMPAYQIHKLVPAGDGIQIADDEAIHFVDSPFWNVAFDQPCDKCAGTGVVPLDDENSGRHLSEEH